MSTVVCSGEVRVDANASGVEQRHHIRVETAAEEKELAGERAAGPAA